jgi:hypothetical protein
MRFSIAAALALLAACPIAAQTMTAAVDLGTATPVGGGWTYAASATGSESRFANVSGSPQLWINCIRATRHVTIAKPASAAAPFLNVWTSSQARNVSSSYNPATGRLTIALGAYDPLLDAIVASRGRVAFGVAGQAPLVVPPWAEIARVIEDCRA